MTVCACSGSRIRLQPALCFAIFGTGQPMLTSTMSAPMPSTICAAAAILAGSPPKICTAIGRSSSVYSAYSSVRSIPRTSPSELTISVTTRPQPPCRLTSRRNAVSVMPAMGATPRAGSMGRGPIFMRALLGGLLRRLRRVRRLGGVGRLGRVFLGFRREARFVGLLDLVVLPLDDGLLAHALDVFLHLGAALAEEDLVRHLLAGLIERERDGRRRGVELDQLP